MGYHRAGFEVEGVDIKPQPHYPFKFYEADALEFPLEGYDAYHASPPCQKFTACVNPLGRAKHLDLITPTRERLLATSRPFIIENVPGSPLQNYIEIDGTMVGLKTIKNRWFELHGFEILLLHTKWNAKGMVKTGEFVGIMRHGKTTKERTRREHLAEGYGIDWFMNRHELREAIPPAYTKYIGKYLIEVIMAKEKPLTVPGIIPYIKGDSL